MRNKTQTALGPQPLRPYRGVQRPEAPPHWHRFCMKETPKGMKRTKNLGEVSNDFEKRAKLRAVSRWLLKRVFVMICHGGLSFSAIIPSMRVIGGWMAFL